MLRRVACLAVLTALAVPASAQEWKKFSGDSGRFSVDLPGEPKQQKQEVPTDAGKITLTMYIVEAGNGGYFVALSDFPAALVQAADPEALLTNARDGAVRNVRGKLTGDKAITLGEYKGREIQFEAGNATMKIVGQARLYLVGNRLYQLLVVGQQAEALEQSARFFNSFRLAD
jgi:hypothetical protein